MIRVAGVAITVWSLFDPSEMTVAVRVSAALLGVTLVVLDLIARGMTPPPAGGRT